MINTKNLKILYEGQVGHFMYTFIWLFANDKANLNNDLINFKTNLPYTQMQVVSQHKVTHNLKLTTCSKTGHFGHSKTKKNHK